MAASCFQLLLSAIKIHLPGEYLQRLFGTTTGTSISYRRHLLQSINDAIAGRWLELAAKHRSRFADGGAAQRHPFLGKANVPLADAGFPNHLTTWPSKPGKKGQHFQAGAFPGSTNNLSVFPAAYSCQQFSNAAASSAGIESSIPGQDTSMDPSRSCSPRLASAQELPTVIPFTLDLSHRNKGLVDQLEVRYTGEAWEDPSVTER
jgi:hypothetical protein